MVTVPDTNAPDTNARSHVDIIDDGGGSTEFGRKINEDANKVKQWKRTDSIPPAYWTRVVAEKLATLDELANAAASRRSREPAAA